MRIAEKSKAIGLAILALGLACAIGTVRAQSQGTAPPPPPPGRSAFFVRVGPGPLAGDEAIGFVGFEEGLGGNTVTSSPFTATISTETTQVLADGNRIQRTTTGTMARDSQGRTRRDMALPAIGGWAAANTTTPHVVFINDVVAGTQYVLQPDRKVAHSLQIRHRGAHPRVRGSQNSVAGAGVGRNVTTSSLGTQTINGVVAQGTLYTRTIPAGQVGNEKPIVITTERWYSPDLQMVVMTKRTDPIRGNSTWELTNIQRQEPDPTLFQVPSDYTMKTGAVRGFHGRHASAGPDAAGSLPAQQPPQN
jgi:hypothetical protein